MIDGIYQSVMVFFIPYLLFAPGKSLTFNGLSVEDRYRFGAYIAHPAIITINGYILINTFRWDWLMLVIVIVSDLFIFFWTGIYTSFTSSGTFYRAGSEVYGEATFWAIYFIVPVMCLFPRFAIKALQKVYWPYDVDIVREQELLGYFKNMGDDADATNAGEKEPSDKSAASGSPRRSKHMAFGSVDEDQRPIYPPSEATRTTTHNRTQNGSDSTNYTNNRASLEVPMHIRPSIDRARPSYDRMRMSMDRVRPSFEASHDFTSAARLTRLESSHSHNSQPAGPATPGGRLKARLRVLSLSKTANT